jgi:subtilase family serine protease
LKTARQTIARALAAGGCAALLFLLVTSAWAAESRVLPHCVPADVARLHLQQLGRLPATNQLHLAIQLPLRNQADLTTLLRQLYDRGSANFHRYLTPEQFTERFGPTEQDYEAVTRFAKASRLEVAATHSSRILLDVQGKAPDIEKAFHVTLHTYQHPTEARQFYAPDVEPSVDASLPILDIRGLSDYARLHPTLRRKQNKAKAIPALGGSGPNSYFIGSDFRRAYVPGVTLTGSGQMVGLFEADGYYTNDIASYETRAGLSNVPLINVLITNFNGSPGQNNDEVALDIDMAIAMAPGLAAVVVFEGPGNSSDWIDILDTMSSSNQIKQFSSSWNYFATPDPDTNFDNIFQKMAAQGQSYFQAAGDGDAYIAVPVATPSDSPYVTSVGGTTLTMTNSGSNYVSEIVWNWGFTPPGWSGISDENVGSGGGISTVYSTPYWQQGMGTPANGGSATMRNIPDVALTGDNVFVYVDNGLNDYLGGTSVAAPLWAGFTALVNQQAAAAGQPTVGFLNPALYALGQGSNYANCFHDITTGSNAWPGSSNEINAVPGYDLCTGWGTPSGSNLINALCTRIVVWVNFTNPNPGDGSFQNPYNTLAAATNAVPTGGTIYVTGSGSTSEKPKLTKRMTIRGVNSSSVIGP